MTIRKSSTHSYIHMYFLMTPCLMFRSSGVVIMNESLILYRRQIKKAQKLSEMFLFLVEENEQKINSVISRYYFPNLPKQILTHYLCGIQASKKGLFISWDSTIITPLSKIVSYLVHGVSKIGCTVLLYCFQPGVAHAKINIFSLETCICCSSIEHEIWIIYRGPGFLAVVWFGSSPTPSPVSKLSLFLSLPLCRR